jgi:hypothetical protein
MQRYRLAVLTIALACGTVHLALAGEPINIASRLELFVDGYLVESLTDGVEFYLHKPESQEVVLVADKPWEGNTSVYYTVFRDGKLYRMYYRGPHFDTEKRQTAHREVVSYAESKDGIHWTKPELGLFEFEGSKANNIVWDGLGTHNFAPFKDANPETPDDARYKALAGGRGGLLAFQSPDGIHWSLMAERPVITDGAFDSQNLAFWDAERKEYRAYWRIFKGGVRDIRTATSKNFADWAPWADLDYGDAPKEHLYTNAILPYERAPHILIGFPTWFLPKTQQVEPTFMTSRDGRVFRRWTEALIPLDAPQDRDGNRSNYMAWGLVQLPGNDRQYSMYASEAYYTGPAGRLRRFTYRVDGFVSLRGSARGGALVTRPLVFQGAKLVVNSVTSGRGSVSVEIQDAKGKPIDGFSLAECKQFRGDSIEQVVTWKTGADLAAIAGKPVRLRFQLKEADLFSFRFRE